MPLKRINIKIGGTVQGVGFRPFIYNLAGKYNLTGSVLNDTHGVVIAAQGLSDILGQFVESIEKEPPRLARPNIIELHEIPVVTNEKEFRILESAGGVEKSIEITVDTAICEDCRRELHDPNDRRYRYPFINCTNCGPRYTIISDIPYDRSNTTMHKFTMCPECRGEYFDPSDRRYHAQPNACPVCGPQVWLRDSEGEQMAAGDEAIQETVRLLEAGKIVAIKGLGGFHLAVRADHIEGVNELRHRKYRKAKAFAIMVRDIQTADQYALLNETEKKLLDGIEKPIVLCRKKENAVLCAAVAPRSHHWGIMLPYTPLHVLIMEGHYPALVMTSGNNMDEPIECDNEGATNHLHQIADAFLLHDRDIYTSCDDSIVKVEESTPLLLRRARGYAPGTIAVTMPDTASSSPDILAVGAELKNTITFLKSGKAYISQHIGDLKTTSTYETFQRTIDKLGALIGAHPSVIACDLHPAMLSTKYAETYQNCRLLRIQHHHAHAAAVMGEHDLFGSIAALISDGVGYGTDGTTWGCELMTCRRESFERIGHLEQVAMPGGDAASREPWRMAVSYLINTYGVEQGDRISKELLPDIDPENIDVISQMITRNFNVPLSSSLGRLFDGVSALLGICTNNTYDAQAAIELEYVARSMSNERVYVYTIEQPDSLLVLRTGGIIAGIVDDLHNGVDLCIISGTFHNTIAGGLSELLLRHVDMTGLRDIVLGGGVFQNDILLHSLINTLQKKRSDLNIYINQKLPVNDGVISFGQAVVAAAKVAGNRHPIG